VVSFIVPEPPPCPVLVVSHLFLLFSSELPEHGPGGPCEQVVVLAAIALEVSVGAIASAAIAAIMTAAITTVFVLIYVAHCCGKILINLLGYTKRYFSYRMRSENIYPLDTLPKIFFIIMHLTNYVTFSNKYSGECHIIVYYDFFVLFSSSYGENPWNRLYILIISLYPPAP
jgi:hypothetical protein